MGNTISSVLRGKPKCFYCCVFKSAFVRFVVTKIRRYGIAADKLRHWGTNFLYVSVVPERSTNFARKKLIFFDDWGSCSPPRPVRLCSSSWLCLTFLPSPLTFINDANKDVESHIADSFTQEGRSRMICPIYTNPFCIVTSCNPRYSMYTFLTFFLLCLKLQPVSQSKGGFRNP